MSCDYCGRSYEICERYDTEICDECISSVNCEGCESTEYCSIFSINNDKEEVNNSMSIEFESHIEGELRNYDDIKAEIICKLDTIYQDMLLNKNN